MKNNGPAAASNELSEGFLFLFHVRRKRIRADHETADIGQRCLLQRGEAAYAATNPGQLRSGLAGRIEDGDRHRIFGRSRPRPHVHQVLLISPTVSVLLEFEGEGEDGSFPDVRNVERDSLAQECCST